MGPVRVPVIVFFILLFCITSSWNLEAAAGWSFSDLGVLRLNMRGAAVMFLQNCLAELGYLAQPADGVFGPATRQGVMAFQTANGLRSDGIVGKTTWEALEELLLGVSRTYTVKAGDTLWGIARQHNVAVSDLVRVNGLSNPDRIRPGQVLQIPKGAAKDGGEVIPSVALLPWEEVNRLFPREGIAEIIDLESGLRFAVRRLFGTNHADVEPLTRADTEIMKKALGGSWSWARRSIAVKCNGLYIAASMNGMSHGTSSIEGNNFPGHFCIHFYDSRLHSGDRLDPEHQRAVMQALLY
ncbi:MAG: LysM peptidoglycan-binding domain-containing protein [Firmicutes bacterium]|nr:LysM peptidoglycan-binding domain-containing protein [Bacillota bacterium]